MNSILISNSDGVSPVDRNDPGYNRDSPVSPNGRERNAVAGAGGSHVSPQSGGKYNPLGRNVQDDPDSERPRQRQPAGKTRFKENLVGRDSGSQIEHALTHFLPSS